MWGRTSWLARRLRGPEVPIWYDPRYRLPLPGLGARPGVELRRADFVIWYLLGERIAPARALRRPRRASYEELARVHTHEYLESLVRPETLARIFAAHPSEISVDETLESVRLACGATVDAARRALRTRGAALNLLGGFHHAAPDHGGGLCALNDVAVALAALRHDGFSGQVAVIDCDAHPPDGTAACLRGDRAAWIGSLSASDWGPVPGARERLLPEGTGDAAYLDALDELLAEMPPPALAFVLAGGDVLAGDHLGQLGLTLAGARRRDLHIARALRGVPTVWLPAGGYHEDAWKVLAGTALALYGRGRRPVGDADPLHGRYARIAARLSPARLHDDFDLTEADLMAGLGVAPGRPTLLGYYSAEGIEYALFRYGILGTLSRLGYDHFHVTLEPVASGGDRAQLRAQAAGRDWLLVDLVLEKRQIAGRPVLYVHWLSLRNPRARFGNVRPQLPGQEVPGLGLLRESGELLERIAERLGLDGIAFRPAWLHTAYIARAQFRFVDAARQGRFEALVRDLGPRPLDRASRALAEGHVKMDGKPYSWEADEMVHWLHPQPFDEAAVAAAREAAHFTVADEDADG